MRNLSFETLRAHYPDKIAAPPSKLFGEIGLPELANDKHWAQNTCAVRLSLALVKAGVIINPGHMTIMNGAYKGRRLEPSQARLSRFLAQSSELGAPEKYKGSGLAQKGIGGRRGIISFYKLNGPDDSQGHIDLIQPSGGFYACAAQCFWKSVEIWFWPLR